MALERKWNAVSPQSFTTDGSAQGLITLASTKGFRTKQVAYLKSTANPIPLIVQIKRVLSPTLLIVGKNDNAIGSWKPFDVSAYTVASGATIGAEEQNKNNVPRDDHYSAIYESDPVVADRVVFVDQFGQFYDDNNPLPIIFDGTISIGSVIVYGQNGYSIEPNIDGSVNVNITEPSLDPNIQNISVPTANTEQSFTFPAKTKKFLIKVRDGEAKMRIAFVSGDTATKYLTISMGSYYSEDIDVSGKTIYFQLNKASKIIELQYWTQP